MNAETEMGHADGLGTSLEVPEGCTGAVMYDPKGRSSIQHDAGTCPIHEQAGTPGQRVLRDLAEAIGYSDGSDDDEKGGVDALIDYKNALEDRLCSAVDELEEGLELRCACGEWIDVPDAGEIVECRACGTRYECSPAPHVRVDGPETAEGGLIGQQPY